MNTKVKPSSKSIHLPTWLHNLIKYLEKGWHYLVVPPLVEKAKRLEHEEKKKQKSKDEDDDDDFEIDYKRATSEFFRRLFAEFIGTMLLTAGHGADRLESKRGLISNESAAFNNGVSLLFLVYSLGGLSGAHFNPIVTMAFTARLVFPWIWLPFYLLFQFIGALCGGLIIRALFGGTYAALGTNSVDTHVTTVASCFKWEIFLTFCLLFVILQTATKANIIGSQAAIAVGAVAAFDSLLGGYYSTSSMNPFRTLGPSIINNSTDNRHSLWIYIVGPFLGGLLAWVVVSLLQGYLPKSKNEIISAHGEELNNVPDEIDV
ncbi:unnamed protein product [Didymodactylos carnosus]|uniref:Aquaporin n=1 Tax=Didymodactylos carnosus TaxID=1234261 RepID=A0A814WCE7_9BILA|nr:unnamed protein product [Didymodactylos carnosus]CAF1199458.1 unnamed protein product [Didymodactylos carnosus]CAF3841565.1 unnamed protein product [Didymodactylos carnosus]CAF3964089.1 unnamed protein product [Didymodactylos carnosus]